MNAAAQRFTDLIHYGYEKDRNTWYTPNFFFEGAMDGTGSTGNASGTAPVSANHHHINSCLNSACLPSGGSSSLSAGGTTASSTIAEKINSGNLNTNNDFDFTNPFNYYAANKMYAKSQGRQVKIWGLFANGKLEYWVLPSDTNPTAKGAGAKAKTKAKAKSQGRKKKKNDRLALST